MQIEQDATALLAVVEYNTYVVLLLLDAVMSSNALCFNIMCYTFPRQYSSNCSSFLLFLLLKEYMLIMYTSTIQMRTILGG